MRLVVKNKEEGTELFKGGNYRPAAARYHKALSHSGIAILSYHPHTLYHFSFHVWSKVCASYSPS